MISPYSNIDEPKKTSGARRPQCGCPTRHGDLSPLDIFSKTSSRQRVDKEDRIYDEFLVVLVFPFDIFGLSWYFWPWIVLVFFFSFFPSSE